MDLKYLQTILMKHQSIKFTVNASASFAESKVRIMPDVHWGKGCVIGLQHLEIRLF